MAYKGIYVARHDATSVSGAITLVQINAPATAAIEVLRAWCTFASTTSTAIGVRLARRSTAGTGSSFTAIVLNGAAAFSGTCTYNHTAEGTLGDSIIREQVNYLNGFLYLPVPEERIIVPPSGRISLGFPSAPGAAVTVTAGIVFGTIG
jgi:hypothetical protein